MTESTFAERSRALNESIEKVRAGDTPRNRAILAYARIEAAYCGFSWDAMPWRSSDPLTNDQAFYVMHGIHMIDTLLSEGAIALDEGERRG